MLVLKIAFFHTLLHLTPPIGGPRGNIATVFGKVKLEWCDYSMVRKQRGHVQPRWYNTGV